VDPGYDHCVASCRREVRRRDGRAGVARIECNRQQARCHAECNRGYEESRDACPNDVCASKARAAAGASAAAGRPGPGEARAEEVTRAASMARGRGRTPDSPAPPTR
jgi:hypothetical protein